MLPLELVISRPSSPAIPLSPDFAQKEARQVRSAAGVRLLDSVAVSHQA